jgi:hypothetical protein
VDVVAKEGLMSVLGIKCGGHHDSLCHCYSVIFDTHCYEGLTKVVSSVALLTV